MQTTHRILLSLALIPLLASAGCATVRLTPEEQAALQVLQRYLELDRGGARLDSARYHLIAELDTWEDEPGWDQAVVVTGWAIGRPQVSGDTLSVRVRYDVEGLLELDRFTRMAEAADAATVLNENAEATFVLTLREGKWRIESPLLPPHIGFPTAIRQAESLQAEALVAELKDAEYDAKLKGQRAGKCNCGRLDF